MSTTVEVKGGGKSEGGGDERGSGDGGGLSMTGGTSQSGLTRGQTLFESPQHAGKPILHYCVLLVYAHFASLLLALVVFPMMSLLGIGNCCFARLATCFRLVAEHFLPKYFHPWLTLLPVRFQSPQVSMVATSVPFFVVHYHHGCFAVVLYFLRLQMHT